MLPLYLFTEKALLWRQDGPGGRVYYPETFLVRNVTIFAFVLCVLGFSVFELASRTDLVGTMSQVVGLMNQAGKQSQVMGADQLAFLEMLIKFFPAIIALDLVIILLVNGAIAQKILEKKKLAFRPEFSITKVEASEKWLYALAGCGVLALLFDGPVERLALNVALVLMLPFWMVGMGTIHHLIGVKIPSLKSSIWALYVLIFLILVSHLIIVALGVFEPWIRMRGRLAAPSDG